MRKQWETYGAHLLNQLKPQIAVGIEVQQIRIMNPTSTGECFRGIHCYPEFIGHAFITFILKLLLFRDLIISTGASLSFTGSITYKSIFLMVFELSE